MQTKAIVLRMSMEIEKGSLFGLLGPNGAGKTTTLKLITGRIRASSGSVTVLGLDPWKNRVELFKKIGYLPQNPVQHLDKKVLQFMRYMARLKGYSGSQATIEARDVLFQVGLARFEQSHVGKLSGGETQRLGFANALIGDPEILILDEPTASLDPEGRVYVMKLITGLAKNENKTILISSHILPEIQRMTNHLAIMSEGKILVTGNMRELTSGVYDDQYEIETSHPEDLMTKLNDIGYIAHLEHETVIVKANGKLQQLWLDVPSICQEHNFELRSYKPVRDALESVFLRLVSNDYLYDGGNNK